MDQDNLELITQSNCTNHFIESNLNDKTLTLHRLKPTITIWMIVGITLIFLSLFMVYSLDMIAGIQNGELDHILMAIIPLSMLLGGFVAILIGLDTPESITIKTDGTYIGNKLLSRTGKGHVESANLNTVVFPDQFTSDLTLKLKPLGTEHVTFINKENDLESSSNRLEDMQEESDILSILLEDFFRNRNIPFTSSSRQTTHEEEKQRRREEMIRDFKRKREYR